MADFLDFSEWRKVGRKMVRVLEDLESRGAVTYPVMVTFFEEQNPEDVVLQLELSRPGELFELGPLCPHRPELEARWPVAFEIEDARGKLVGYSARPLPIV